MSRFEAVEFYGGERVELVERPVPRPRVGELLLAPLVVGVCGTDVEIYEGTMAYYRLGLARYPVVPGHEWVAEVLDAGEGVDGFEQGDRVVGECSIGCARCLYCREGRYHLCAARTETGILKRDGGMASRMLFPARSAFTIPRSLALEAAALVEPTAVALNTVRRAAVSGRTVLVIGAGSIGTLAAQCARADGAAAVLIGDPIAERREIAHELGFDALLPFGNGIAEDLVCVREVSGDRGVDVALVCAGSHDALTLALEAVRPGGTVVVPALFGRASLSVDIDGVVVRDVAVHGVLGSPRCWPEAISLLTAGDVVTEPLVGARFGLGEVPEAMHALRSGGAKAVKVLIDPTKTRM